MKRQDCDYNKEECKKCICPSCTNKKCHKVFCNKYTEDNYISCSSFIDWIKILTLSRKEIKNREDKRPDIIKMAELVRSKDKWYIE